VFHGYFRMVNDTFWGPVRDALDSEVVKGGATNLVFTGHSQGAGITMMLAYAAANHLKSAGKGDVVVNAVGFATPAGACVLYRGWARLFGRAAPASTANCRPGLQPGGWAQATARAPFSVLYRSLTYCRNVCAWAPDTHASFPPPQPPPPVGDTKFTKELTKRVNARQVFFINDLVPDYPCTSKRGDGAKSMPACAGTLVPTRTIKSKSGWPDYQQLWGQILVTGQDEPIQKEQWATTNLVTAATGGRRFIETHRCSYQCFLSTFVTDFRDNRCILDGSSVTGYTICLPP
jgi:hypothetical protein